MFLAQQAREWLPFTLSVCTTIIFGHYVSVIAYNAGTMCPFCRYVAIAFLKIDTFSDLTTTSYTVEPLLSGHPRGMARWPFNRGMPNMDKNVVKWS